MSSVLSHQERSSLCHVHHMQVIRELGKRSSLLFLSVVTANIFHFLLRERTDYIVQHSAAQCLYCQPWLSSVHFLPQPIPCSHFMFFLRPELLRFGFGFFFFVILCVFVCFSQGFQNCAFKGNFENVIGQNERKISSDLSPV